MVASQNGRAGASKGGPVENHPARPKRTIHKVDLGEDVPRAMIDLDGGHAAGFSKSRLDPSSLDDKAVITSSVR
jgi:hypothetical protein